MPPPGAARGDERDVQRADAPVPGARAQPHRVLARQVRRRLRSQPQRRRAAFDPRVCRRAHPRRRGALPPRADAVGRFRRRYGAGRGPGRDPDGRVRADPRRRGVGRGAAGPPRRHPGGGVPDTGRGRQPGRAGREGARVRGLALPDEQGGLHEARDAQARGAVQQGGGAALRPRGGARALARERRLPRPRPPRPPQRPGGVRGGRDRRSPAQLPPLRVPPRILPRPQEGPEAAPRDGAALPALPPAAPRHGPRAAQGPGVLQGRGQRRRVHHPERAVPPQGGAVMGPVEGARARPARLAPLRGDQSPGAARGAVDLLLPLLLRPAPHGAGAGADPAVRPRHRCGPPCRGHCGAVRSGRAGAGGARGWVGGCTRGDGGCAQGEHARGAAAVGWEGALAHGSAVGRRPLDDGAAGQEGGPGDGRALPPRPQLGHPPDAPDVPCGAPRALHLRRGPGGPLGRNGGRDHFGRHRDERRAGRRASHPRIIRRPPRPRLPGPLLRPRLERVGARAPRRLGPRQGSSCSGSGRGCAGGTREPRVGPGRHR
mmetsp:Transcript_30352/g.72179  ORF Transcript_30352/g.72179 Transcript_30352/m.72179 type:complete len:544 (+) Transcript_30352:1068-2699(+)